MRSRGHVWAVALGLVLMCGCTLHVHLHVGERHSTGSPGVADSENKADGLERSWVEDQARRLFGVEVPDDGE